MIKSILACTDGSAYGDVASQYGICMADHLQARLVGLHVLDSRMLEGPLLADIAGWVGAQPYAAQVEQFRTLMEQKGQAIAGAFESRCKEAGVKAEALIRNGHPPTVILEEEVRAELIVLGQKGEHAEWIGDMTGSTVERVARHSVKPCLITPKRFSPVHKILAAYDGSAHASQALREAAELAMAMKMELVLLTVAESSHEEQAEKISKDGMALVKAHGCGARPLVAKGRPASAILDAARDGKCDLIVVGAYGHSRIREMILGSVTTQVMTMSQVPVMLVR